MGKKEDKKRGSFNPTPNEMKEIELLAGYGMPKYLIQSYFGIKDHVWRSAEGRNPELKDAFMRGKAVRIKKVVAKLMRLVDEGNLRAIMFYLEKQGGWSGNYDPQTDARVSEPNITINVSDPVEATKIYQQIIRGEHNK